MALDTYLELYDASGLRLALDQTQVQGLTWTVNDRGGMGEVQVTLSAELAAAMALPDQARLDLWLGDSDEITCRGYLEDRTPVEGAPDQTQLIFSGRVLRAQKLLPQRLFLFPSGRDVREVFVTLSGWAQEALPGLEVEVPADATGFTVSQLDGRVANLAELMDQLCDAAQNTLVWGFGVDTSGADLLYLRPRSSTVTRALPVPAEDISSASATRRTSEIVNRLHLTASAEVESPNLLPNASFESPVAADEETGNLLTNGDFEDGPPTQSAWDVPGWTQVSTASAKERGGGTGEPDPYSGDWHIETDNFGEAFYQDVSGIVPGHRYGVVLYARPEGSGATTAGGSVLLYWKTGGSVGAPAAPVGLGTTWLPINCEVAAYERFVGQWIAPSGIDGLRLRAELNSGGGTMLWDKFALIDLDDPAQSGWQVTANGSATRTVTWADTSVPAAHGAYSVGLDVSTSDSDTDDVVLEPLTRPEVVPGARYWLLASYQSDAAAPKISFRAQFYKEDGTATGAEQVHTTTHGAALSAWYRDGFIAVAPADAATVRVQVRLRASGLWNLDAFTLQDVRAYNGVPGVTAGTVPGVDAPYQTDGTPVVVFDAATLIGSGEDAEAHDSVSLYGLRDGQETASELVTLSEMTAFATAYLRTRAKAMLTVEVTLEEDRGVQLTDLVRLIGENGPALAPQPVPVSQVSGTQDGAGKVSLAYQLGEREILLESIIARVARRESRFLGKVPR